MFKQYAFWIVFIVIGFVTLSNCSKYSNDVKHIPLFLNNKECVIDYLSKINFPMGSNGLNIKEIPFEVNTPSNQLVGFLQLIPDKKRNMQAIYKALGEFCYSSQVIEGELDKDNWSKLIEDVRLIFESNRYGNLDTERPIYVEIDNKNKKFTIYQDGIRELPFLP